VRTLLGIALAAVVAGMLLALTAGQALASHVQCGDVITQDTTVDSDLLGCGYPALTIGAGDVTLDLNRHVVEGGIETPVQAGDLPSGLLIENGTVRGGGVSISYFEDVTIQHLTADGIGVGPYVYEAQIAHNVVRGGFGAGAGRSSDVTISDNLIERNGSGVNAVAAGVTLIGNTIRANQNSGVHGGLGGNFIAVANKIVGNGSDGIAVNEGHAVLRDNLIAANGGDGVHAEFASLLAEGNTISRNGRSGVFGELGTKVLTDNTVSQNVEDGIRIGERGVQSATLTANRTDRNGDDGIDVDGLGSFSGVTLTSNHAWFNGDLGIEALSGVTDGGGNWAKHNGNPAQCVPGSLCSARGKPK
jgi:hypothetical protein